LFAKVVPERKNRLMWAIGIFTGQYLTVQMFPNAEGYHGWLLFSFIIARMVGIDYPPAQIEEPLDSRRQFLGWLALIIFIISFSPAPIMLSGS